MAGLSDSAAVISLRIKSDSSDAQADFKKFKKELNEIDREAKASGTALDKLGAMSGLSAQQFDNLKVGALAAVAGIGAVVSVAAAAAVGIFNLSKATADFGSELFDAQAKTGLSAETLSTLKLNADKAGSSFEQVTMVVGKFSVLLGKAQQDNVKAQETLAKYGVTALDTSTALEQAITTIAAMETVELRAAAAAELWGDKKRVMLPIIEQLNGSLSEATKETIRTGQAMTDKGIRAADDFGDALVDLNAQAAATGRQFATEMMPMITGAMKSVSQAMVDNKDRVAEWGQNIADTMRGTVIAVQRGHDLIKAAIVGISTTFGANKNSADGWANNLLANIGRLVNKFNVLYLIMQKIKLIGADARPIAGLGGEFDPNAGGGDINLLGSGGGKGGGGRSPKGGGGKAAESDYEIAAKNQQFLLEMFKEGADSARAENDRKLAYLEQTEAEHVAEMARLKKFEITYEIELTQDLLNIAKINAKEKEEAERKLASLKTKLHTQETRNAIDIRKTEAEALDDAAADLAAFEKLKEAVHERDLERIEKERKAKNERGKQQANQNQRDREERKRELEGRTQGATLDGGGFSGGLLGAIGIMGDATLNARDKAAAAANGIKASWESMGSVVMGGIDQMVQGLGSMVEAWVLYGSAGPQAMKKMVASVLAGVAAQSAVLAIFELAKGFASLWLNPKEAADHFIAAALFGSIAVGAALGGRAVAGDSFSQSTANGGAGGGGSSDGLSDQDKGQNTFTTPFRGFGQNGQGGGIGARLTGAIVQLEETTMQLATKIKGFSPGDVLGMGADENPRAIRGALESELSNDVGTTGAMMRGLGFAT